MQVPIVTQIDAPGNQILPAGEPKTLAFTIATSSHVLTKTFTVGALDDKIVQVGGTGLSRGNVRRITLAGTATDMAGMLAVELKGLKQTEALIPAPPPPGKDEWPLVLKDEAASRPEAVARTKQHFRREDGPGLLVLDFDTKGYPQDILKRLDGCEGITGALKGILSGFDGAACVIRPSVSAGIKNRRTGEKKGKASGQHRYFLALDGGDADDFAKRVGDYLILAGWCWGEVSKAGGVLFRTLIDVAASSDPVRLFYVADAVLDHPDLERVPGLRDPEVRRGGFLDTRALLPLTDREHAQVERIKEQIRKDLEPQAAPVRDARRAERLPKLKARGVAQEVAERTLSAAYEANELLGDLPIELDTGATVTVRDILKSPKVYHKQTCADPLEPEYGGGKNLAKIYTLDGLPQIFSHAHGGIRYLLKPDIDDFFEAVDATASPAAAAEDWAEPIDLFGDGDARALMEAPAGSLPVSIERFSRDTAERMGAPLPFVAMSAVASVSAAIGGAIRIQPKALDTGWTEPPFLWVALVELPGGKKTPSMSAAVAPLLALDARRRPADQARRNEWDRANKARKRDESAPAGNRPPIQRTVVGAFTMEALRDVLADNPKGALVHTDELAQLIGSMDQYKPNGGSDRADILQLMNGHTLPIDRVGQSWLIKCWGASVLGGIQPAKLAKIAKDLDSDGLLQRFLPIVGDNERRDGVDRAPDGAALTAYNDLVVGLASLPAESFFYPAVVTLSPAAHEVRLRFDKAVTHLLDIPQGSDAWRGHLSKWSGFFARLLLTFHIADHWAAHGEAVTSLPVSADTARRTERFAQFLLVHAIHFYVNVIGLGASGDAARRAAGLVLVSGQDKLSKRDLYDKNHEWRKDGTGELLDAMRTLGRLGWCRPSRFDKDGRPAEWAINPQVYVRFKDRAAVERDRLSREYAKVQAAAAAQRALHAREG